ncbi:anaphase-promoting complex subunit 1 isoform X2 [Neocloeon triangulifer]|uniref:anaphase-promoting complex subunit 1 isoform X2 n=1 Tax=Neocloeon triangulifer TaxID=2078957 RepID=UPI00286FA689|nr:anaphase-promoting complex subunit 1 isoform X2 [Neocloeon triangulifer]
MIAATDVQDWLPHGRSLEHPGQLAGVSGSEEPHDRLIEQLSNIDLSDAGKEWWCIRSSPDVDGAEEELYINGRTVIWSQGSHSRWITLRSFTSEFPVQLTCWATFRDSPSLHQLPLKNDLDSFIKAICIVDTHNINVFTTDGRDFVTSSPFPVSKIWPMKSGLMLEMEADIPVHSEISALQYPLVFSLHHPYDDIKPVMTKQGSRIGAVTDPGQRIVFTSEDPSICMLYDSITGTHSVWAIRNATLQESFTPRGNEEISLAGESILSGPLHESPLEVIGASPIPSALAASSPISSKIDLRRSSFMATSPTHHSNLSSRRHTVIGGSPFQLKASPLLNASKRCSLADSLGGGGGTPFSERRGSIDCRSPLNVAADVPVQPLYPEVCLEFLWAESLKEASRSGGASKAFLTTDFVGQTYLCYLVPGKRELFLVKLEETNRQEQLIFCTRTSVPARDAVPLTDLPMIVVLEVSGGITLYSGPDMVSKIFLPNLLPPQTPIPTRSFHSLITSPSSSRMSESSFKIRRSSLQGEMTMDGSYFADASCVLSPVPKHLRMGSCITLEETHISMDEVLRLRDETKKRITLEFNNGHMVRTSLPELYTSLLVRKCVQTLRIALKRENAILLLTKWYCARNAPGSQDISADTEWQLFLAALLGLMGYEVEKLKIIKKYDSSSAPQEKRKRKSEAGSKEDWSWVVLNHQKELSDMCSLLRIDCPELFTQEKSVSGGRINTNAPLFKVFETILQSLHLLYEEMKLDALCKPELPQLAQLLHLLASDLQIPFYIEHYWRDYPHLCCPYESSEFQMHESDLSKLGIKVSNPASIMLQVQTLLECNIELPSPYLYMPQVNDLSRNVVQLTALLTLGMKDKNLGLEPFINYMGPVTFRKNVTKEKIPFKASLAERAVLLMVQRKITKSVIERLPGSIALLFMCAIAKCRENPPPDWSLEAFNLVGREDLATLCSGEAMQPPREPHKLPNVQKENSSENIDDGMEDLNMEALKLRFPKDQRVASVRRMLQSAKPVKISIIQRPEVSDHDYIEEQEKQLLSLCTRTLGLPVGRGMFTLASVEPVVLEPLPVPKLCLTGKSPIRGTSIDLSHIETVANMNYWPLFHNGVAAGLKVSPNAPGIDSTWIGYNRQKGNADAATEHAGFLMALGLNGHLKTLKNFKIYEYLNKCHEMTSVGLLLGIAASKRGSSDQEASQAIRTVCLHIEAMLPPTSLELNIAQNIQVAALLGLGLLYQGSAHRHIAEVLLSEIGRPPGPEMENCVDRESYSLAAGLALGLVVLGQGNGHMAGLKDLAIPDTLHHYMVGGHVRQLPVAQREKYKNPSYQIREGDYVNVHVTCPGATLALGMLYFRTGNESVAGWMEAPDTQYLLDFIRPDFLLLRVLAKGLIMWDNIVPSKEWVESNVPESIRPYALAKPQPGTDPSIDLETMNQAYCNILAGSCMAMGLRFAGSANNEAFETLYYYAHHFISLLNKSVAELAGKSTVESCINVVVLSLAMVMAGTGELSVLRLCRFLRSRVGPNHAVVTYGSHLATHMALGLLFLGGGRYTLSTSAQSVAALLCAFFPKFPTHSNDNRYHLQAFRHLYVLAAEPRLLLPRDVDLLRCDYASLRIVYLDTPWYKNQYVVLKAPCLLPELHLIKEIRVEDERYWPITFEKGRNWNQLIQLLKLKHTLPVKKKAGCLSYNEDPLGYRTMFAKSLTSEKSVCWSARMESIQAFSSQNPLVDFAELFVNDVPGESIKEKELKDLVKTFAYECCVHDKTSMLPILLSFLFGTRDLCDGQPNSSIIWQIKMQLKIAELLTKSDLLCPLISTELAISIYSRARSTLDTIENSLRPHIDEYLKCHELTTTDEKSLRSLTAYLSFYDIPMPKLLKIEAQLINPLSLMQHGFPADTALKFARLS